MAERARFDGIDTLRGLSILAVVLLHVSLRMRMAGHELAGLPGWLAHLLFWNGNNGVTVFFAISGFLITTTSLRRFGALDRMRPARFYRLRFARIAPMLLALVGVLCVLHALGLAAFYIQPARASLGRAVVAALGFHLNWLEAQRGYLPASWDVLWSLSVEEAFYLGFPLACVLLRRRVGALAVGALLLALVIAGPFARTVWTANELWREKSYLSGMDAIAMGCVAALVVARGGGWSVRAARGLQLVGAAAMLVIAVWPAWPAVRWLGGAGLDASVLALGACLFMIGQGARRAPAGAWSAPLRALGRASYEVYLTHEFIVIAAAAGYLGGPLALWFAGVVVVATAVGWLVARTFSEPLNRRLRGGLGSPP
jgi:peptidoglycan/LPS O-acetylase OafA/YrhL